MSTVKKSFKLLGLTFVILALPFIFYAQSNTSPRAAEFSKELGLSENQQKAMADWKAKQNVEIGKLKEKSRKELREIKENNRKELREIREKSDKELKSILSETQYYTYKEKVAKKYKKRHQKRHDGGRKHNRDGDRQSRGNKD